MPIRTIEQTVDIDAPRQRVWDVLIQDETYRQWTAEFMAGSYAETDWQEGSTVRFLDPSGQGLVGHIVTFRPPEVCSVEFDGAVVNGQNDYDSPEAREMKGGRETYRLSERAGGTELAIESDMGEAYYDDMAAAWVRALAKVKALAEEGTF